MMPSRSAFPSRQSGVSLIELMVSLVIGLLLVGLVTSYYLSSRQSYQTTMVSAELNNAQRYAMQLLRRQLLQAGYSDAWMDLDTAFPAAAAIDETPAFAAGQVIAGGSDEIWLRYEGSDWFDQDIVDCANRIVPLDDQSVWARIYLDGSTLRCQSSVNDNSEPLLNGVEALTFSYLDSSDSFQDHASADWPTVRAVRVQLLVSSETDTFDAAIAQSFDWQGGTLTFNDRRMRARLSRVVTLRNIMERR